MYNDYEDIEWNLISDAADIQGTTFLGAAFSPNYKSDSEIIAVTTDGTSVWVETMFGKPDDGNRDWNARVQWGILVDDNGDPIDGADAISASIAFPSDYNYSSNNKFFVGIGADGAGDYDVYLAKGSTKSVDVAEDPTEYKGMSVGDEGGSDICSLAYKGSASGGTLVVSFNDTDDICVEEDGAANSPDWVTTDNAPTGEGAQLAFAGNTLYAGTANYEDVAGFGAMFASSTDYNLFDGISLISFTSLAATQITKYFPVQGYLFIQSGNYQLLFNTADGGTTWREIYSYEMSATNKLNQNSVTYQDNNKTLYIPETNRAGPPWAPEMAEDPEVYKSTDGGYTWDTIAPSTKDGSLAAFAMAGPDMWMAAADGSGLYKNLSWDALTDLDGNIPWIMITIPNFFVIFTFGAEVYVSTDGGATFDQLGSDEEFDHMFANALLPPAKTIYAANKASVAPADQKQIYKWVVGESTSWDEVIDLSDVLDNPISGLNLTGGTLYVSTKNGAGDPQIYRCANFNDDSEDTDFQLIKDTGDEDLGGQINSGPLTVVAKDGVNTLLPLVDLDAVDDDAAYGIDSEIKTFTDNMAAPVKTIAPAANAQIEKNYTFTWQKVESNKTVRYQWEIATDDLFQGVQQSSDDDNPDGITATSAYVQNLISGKQYYFRVRTCEPYFSAWSATVPFIVKLADTGNNLAGEFGTRIAPAAGATGVPVMASFQWADVQSADNYKIEVADNPAFATPIESATVADPFYTVKAALKAGTTYYWRIQAISGTTVSDWVSNVFTTAAPAAPAPSAAPAPAPAPSAAPVVVPTPQVTVNMPSSAAPAPANETPAYIWVIIAIGAVLVIAVIVLIARTRRV